MSQLSKYLRRVAREYAVSSHAPRNTHVLKCYRALSAALTAQYALLTAYVDVEFTDRDPYPDSEPMWKDLDNNCLRVYTFADLPVDHPMSASVRENPWSSERVEYLISVNLKFRAVHDAFAHYPERLRHDGRDSEPGRDEFRAFRAHVRLLHGNIPAISALFTETVAQNASYHYGVTPGQFPEQKACILPAALIHEALSLLGVD